jgi:hypothetical protein
MPSIQFYADEQDFDAVFARLAGDEEIAVIVPAGKTLLGGRKWIARRPVERLDDGPHCLWHVPVGPLTLLTSRSGESSTPIVDPFAGWTEKASSGDTRVPFSGASLPAVVTLSVARASREKPGGIAQSAFGWIGNRYRAAGAPAAATTEKWWRNLSRWFAATAAAKVTRWGPPDGDDADIWALPGAHAKIRAGVHRDANPSG